VLMVLSHVSEMVCQMLGHYVVVASIGAICSTFSIQNAKVSITYGSSKF